jgi:hypothetical protein
MKYQGLSCAVGPRSRRFTHKYDYSSHKNAVVDVDIWGESIHATTILLGPAVTGKTIEERSV